jgi:pimeloyl-ACP methyl ester carboxylesterase
MKNLDEIAEDVEDLVNGMNEEDTTKNSGAVTYEPRHPENATSEDIDVTRETKSGPLTLRGTLEMPNPTKSDVIPNDTPSQEDDIRQVPMLVMVHGIVTNRRDPRFDTLSDALLAHGIATLRFDMNGRGQSDGVFEKMTIPREIADLEEIFDFARNLPGVDSERVALLGHSQGGLTSVLYTARHPLDVAALVLTSPAVNIPRDCNNKQFGYPVGKKYLRTAANLRPFREAPSYEGPTCIFGGSNDPLTPAEDIERLYNGYRNADLHMLSGCGHGLRERYDEVVKATVDFLTKAFAEKSHARPIEVDLGAPEYEDEPRI